MSYTPSVSPQYAGIQSKHRALQPASSSLQVLSRHLSNSKFWPGTQADWLTFNFTGLQYPTVAQRISNRKRYSKFEYTLTYPQSPENNADVTFDLVGPGFVPTPSPPLLGPGGGKELYISPSKVGIRPGDGGYDSAVTDTFYPPGVLFLRTTAALSNPVLFADHLSIASNRVRSRLWPSVQNDFAPQTPGAYPPGDVTHGEIFSEWGSSDPSPSGKWFDPDPYHYNGYALANPFFGTSQPASYTGNVITLWSGWYWPPFEENGQPVCGPYNSSPGGGVIATQRTRFQVLFGASPYFIAYANINRFPGTVYGQVTSSLLTILPDGPDSITQVTQISSGIIAPGQTVEIPWPPNDPGDFVQSKLPLENQPTLSCGYIAFAVIGETFTGWKNRNGFK